MSTAPPTFPARSFPPSRLRSFIAFVLALMYVFVAQTISRHAASGLSAGDWVLPIDRLIFLFLLLLGFSALAAGFSRERQRRRALGVVARPGVAREFATGAAVGWALLLVTVLPSVFVGGWNARLWTSPHQWLLLILDLVVLLVSALCTELVFRGYPYQQIMDAIGTTLGTVFISVCFVAVEYDPQMPHAAVFALFLLSLILCIGYLRTRAIWLPWGLHFAWNAAMAPLFGLPLSGMGSGSFTPVVQTVALGPDFVTGGDYGPEGSGMAVLVLLLLGIWLVMRATREYSARYGHPEIIAAGIPVDIDAAARRQHEVAMGPMAEAAPAAPRLVQIGGAPAAPPPVPGRPPAQD